MILGFKPHDNVSVLKCTCERCELRRKELAASDMFEALKSTRLMLHAWKHVQEREKWGPHPELDAAIQQVTAALSKASGEV